MIPRCTHYIVVATTALAGCASPYKYPCEFDVTVRLDNQDSVNRICRGEGNPTGLNDDGSKKEMGRWVGGCAWPDEDFILSRNDEFTIGHEIKHVADRHCK